MAQDTYNVPYQGYLVISQGPTGPVQVFQLPGNTTVTTDTGRGAPDPSQVYCGSDVIAAKDAAQLP